MRHGKSGFAAAAVAAIALAVGVGAPGAASAQTDDAAAAFVRVATGYGLTPNVTYHRAGGRDLTLDVYRPRGASGPNPTLIYIHGGGWTNGSKEASALTFLPYLEMGWSVVNVAYRLADAAHAPAAVEDCRCALRWVYRNAERMGFDLGRIVVTGNSAGGHLALTTGMLPASAGLDRQCPGDLFGYSVALSADGSVLAATAYDEDGSLAGTNEFQDDEVFGTGALYIFLRDGNTWTQQAYLKPSNSERNDAFGVAVVISADGHTVAGTALDEDGMTTGVNSTPQPDMEINLSTGAVYLFTSDGNGWSEQAYIKASNTGTNDTFGARLALSGDGGTLAVGAQLEDSAGQGIDAVQDDDSAQEAGAVYLFSREGSSWTQIAYVKGSNTEAYDEFGSSLALNGNGTLMAVGARGEDSGATGIDAEQDDNSAFESGAVYVFNREP